MKKKVFLLGMAIILLIICYVYSQNLHLSPFKKKIIIVEPNKKSVWIKGTPVAIKWKVMAKMAKFVRIKLFKATEKFPRTLTIKKSFLVITKSTVNDGFHKWTVPKKILAGMYFLSIETIGDQVKVRSADFRISEFLVLKKVDLIISGQYLYWTNPPEDPSDEGYLELTVTNINHSSRKFPCCDTQSQCQSSPYIFKIKVESLNPNTVEPDFDLEFKNQLVPLRNQGWAKMQFSIYDPQFLPIKLTVDYTNKITEEREDNNTFVIPVPSSW